MELVEPIVSWRPGRYLNAARELAASVLARTRWFGSPRTLLPSQVVSPMSEDWMREHESYAAHQGESL